MMLFEAPFEPVLLVNKSETTTSDDAAVSGERRRHACE
jgi:hypothetical protein